MIKKFLSKVFRLGRDSAAVLMENDPLRMAGATAFFCTFALPPIIIIVIRSLGLFFNRRSIGNQLMAKVINVIGPESADQVLNTIRSVRTLEQNTPLAILSFIFLLFVATTLFKVINNSLNQVWDIRIVTRRKIRGVFTSRFHAVVLILLVGLLFLLVLLFDAAQAILGKYVLEIAPSAAFYFNNIFSQGISVVVVTVWFFVLFIYIPDGRPSWQDGLAGALLTSVLFNVGKLVLRALLGNIGKLYGASGAIVFLLLFVFYSSLMLYFGAAFIKVWSNYRRRSIKPMPYAEKYYLAPVSAGKEAKT